MDLIQICVQKMLIYTFSLGFCAKHEAQRVDLRSKVANMQKSSEISEEYNRTIDQI